MNECMFCRQDDEKAFLLYAEMEVEIVEGNKLLIDYTMDSWHDYITINFCPMCGRKLDI